MSSFVSRQEQWLTAVATQLRLLAAPLSRVRRDASTGEVVVRPDRARFETLFHLVCLHDICACMRPARATDPWDKLIVGACDAIEAHCLWRSEDVARWIDELTQQRSRGPAAISFDWSPREKAITGLVTDLARVFREANSGRVRMLVAGLVIDAMRLFARHLRDLAISVGEWTLYGHLVWPQQVDLAFAGSAPRDTSALQFAARGMQSGELAQGEQLVGETLAALGKAFAAAGRSDGDFRRPAERERSTGRGRTL